MKKLLGFAIVFSLMAGVASAATIVGSRHDLSARGYASTQICIYCHTPHNAAAVQLIPLWNHTSTSAVFTVYTSPTMNASPAPGQPTGVSKACLSCHDGTVNIDAFAANVGSVKMTGAALLGTTLANDHPVSFAYDAALVTADGGLATPAVATAGGIELFAGQMECASCHEVHSPTFVPFLRKSNAASALCLTCHLK